MDRLRPLFHEHYFTDINEIRDVITSFRFTAKTYKWLKSQGFNRHELFDAKVFYYAIYSEDISPGNIRYFESCGLEKALQFLKEHEYVPSTNSVHDI